MIAIEHLISKASSCGITDSAFSYCKEAGGFQPAVFASNVFYYLIITKGKKLLLN